ncbi:MAG: type II toxin-antitoxin system VapC family toxin [Alphaproteobacteria bacterium]|nr:type II toxin-antitoxin system VapC family toxin [Alphaproteobacteria bacterium]
MTGYLLDTNTVSELIRPRPQEALLRWLEERQDTELFFSAVSVGEVRRGIVDLPAGRKRQTLDEWYSSPKGPRAWFGDRILAFDERAAEVWADLIAEGRRKGRPRSPIDMMIAATAIVNGLTVVTLNDRDFDGIVAHLNPVNT